MSQKMEAASEATAVAIEQNEAEAVKFIYSEKAIKIWQNLIFNARFISSRVTKNQMTNKQN